MSSRKAGYSKCDCEPDLNPPLLPSREGNLQLAHQTMLPSLGGVRGWVDSREDRLDGPLSQLRQTPFVFAHQLVHDATVLHFRGHYFPGVSFHFQMGAKLRVRFERVHHAEEMVGRVIKERGRFAVQRDVEMNPPLLRELRVGS